MVIGWLVPPRSCVPPVRLHEPPVVNVGRNAPLLARIPAPALRTSPCACTIAGCTCKARRTASWSVTCCGPPAAAGCCAASGAARNPTAATMIIRRMLPLASIPVRVGTVLPLTLMLLLGEESHVLRALRRRELAADLAADHRADRVEARMYFTPQRFHLGPVPRQDRPHRVLLGVREAQVVVQIVDHGVGPAAATVRVAPGGNAPARRPARYEHRDEQGHGPGIRSIEHHDGLSSLCLSDCPQRARRTPRWRPAAALR